MEERSSRKSSQMRSRPEEGGWGGTEKALGTVTSTGIMGRQSGQVWHEAATLRGAGCRRRAETHRWRGPLMCVHVAERKPVPPDSRRQAVAANHAPPLSSQRSHSTQNSPAPPPKVRSLGSAPPCSPQ